MKLRVLSLNVWNGGMVWENLEPFLKAQMPDIAFFQEVFNGSGENLPKRYKTLEEFQKLFPGYYFHFAPAFGDIDDMGTFDRGNAIFSKFPIVNSHITFYDIPYKVFAEQKQRDFTLTPRCLEHCEVDFDGKILNLFNNHGIWGYDGFDNPRRFFMSRVIGNEIKGKKNVILAGDFNLQPDTQAVRNIENYVKSVFGRELVSTFNMKHKTDGGYATAAVDMMFVSDSIQVLEKDCPNVDVSDHLPLIAQLDVV